MVEAIPDPHEWNNPHTPGKGYFLAPEGLPDWAKAWWYSLSKEAKAEIKDEAAPAWYL